ncbi:MAG: hypothetical protein ACFFDN_02455 [Candidatus Hodarchaeota archaeon]
MKNLFISGVHNKSFSISLQSGEYRGKMIADVLKAGFGIYSIIELTDEETESFKKEMNKKDSKIIKPKMGYVF